MIDKTQNPDYRELEARIDDYIRKSDRGELQISSFLTPMQICFAKEILKYKGMISRATFVGGYKSAERARLVLLPAFTEGLDGDAEDLFADYFPDEYRDAVVSLKIQGSGFRALSHRDYMGSILGMGIERDVIGDIATVDDFSAYVFCTRSIANYILSELDKISTDKVKVQEYAPPEDFDGGRRYQRISDTVASERFDCVVASLCNLSRDKAQSAIKSGLCTLDYMPIEECSVDVGEGSVISVRGYGKFIVRSISDPTKKGRIRLLADKYI